jgi:hypothetical protein
MNGTNGNYPGLSKSKQARLDQQEPRIYTDAMDRHG